MITYGRHHPEIRLTIPPCRKPILIRALHGSGTAACGNTAYEGDRLADVVRSSCVGDGR